MRINGVPRDKYGVGGHMLMTIESLYFQPGVCVRTNGKQSRSFHVGFDLRQGCVLLSILFIISMNLMDKLSQTDKCVTIGRCKISRLLFANNLVLLATCQSGLQHALNSFAAACEIAGMKISTAKTEALHFSKNLVQCSLQVGRVSLKQVEKFKYLESHSQVMEGKTKNHDWIYDQAKQVSNASFASFSSFKLELSPKAKLLVFKSYSSPSSPMVMNFEYC